MIYAIDIAEIVVYLAPVIRKHVEDQYFDAVLLVWINEVLFEIFCRPTSTLYRTFKPRMIAEFNICLTGPWFASAILYREDIVDALCDPNNLRYVDNGTLYVENRSFYGSCIHV